MNRNKYMAILIGVTAVCMIIGILYNALGFFRFRTSAEESAPVEITEEWTDGNKEAQEAKRSDASSKAEKGAGQDAVNDAAEKTETEEELASGGSTGSDLRKISADVDIADLKIRSGEELKVDFQGDSDFEPKVTQKDGILTITQNVDTKWFEFFKIRNMKGISITVTVPEGTELAELTTDLDLGDTELTGIKAEKCSVNNELGDIDCEDCSFFEVRIFSSLGNVDMENCDFQDLGVQQDMGDVEISTKQDLSDADLSLETDLGDLHINGQDQGRKHSRSGSSGIRVVVKNDLGDIDLDYAA